MKKTIRIMLALALVIAALSVSVSAAGTNGFYDIGEAADVTITPYAGAEKTAVDAIDADVDADDADEVYYEGSDRFDVAYAGATSGKNYGVILVAGDTLPTASSDIYYINQVQADGETVAFDVYPSDIAETEATMTLYISSDAEGASLVSVPMAYKVGYEEVVVPTFTYGDVDDSGAVNPLDSMMLAQKVARMNVTINMDAADVYKDGAVNPMDSMILAQKVARMISTLPVIPES